MTELVNKVESLSIIGKNKDKDERPTFFHRGKYPLRAGGVLFYHRQDTEVYLLMIKTTDRNGEIVYEDFGGKTDKGDKSIQDTVAREVWEESNNYFSRRLIRNRLKRARYLNIGPCKYNVYMLGETNMVDPEVFGEVETHTGIQRTVEWVNLRDLNNLNLHKRLDYRFVKNWIKNIKSNKPRKNNNRRTNRSKLVPTSVAPTTI